MILFAKHLSPSLAGYAGAPECVSEPWVMLSAVFISELRDAFPASDVCSLSVRCLRHRPPVQAQAW